MKKISILGAGTWGTALAKVLSDAGNEVTLWSAIHAEIDEMEHSRSHKNLPGMKLPEAIKLTKDISEACCEAEYIIFAVPSPYVRSTANSAKPFFRNDQIIIDVAKGIEADTLMMLSEVIKSEVGEDKTVVALSGPTHAEEVAIGLPTTIVSACEDKGAATAVAALFDRTCIRAYTNPDVKGVELCGALKNIVALAAGASDGLGFGDNIKVAIITRGIAEIQRLGIAMGCDPRTFGGLAGIGDLIVTATSRHSRNNRAGYLLGKGYAPTEAIAEVGMVVEGINALPAAIKLSEKYGVELPIISGVNMVVGGLASPKEMTERLMGREQKSEINFKF